MHPISVSNFVYQFIDIEWIRIQVLSNPSNLVSKFFALRKKLTSVSIQKRSPQKFPQILLFRKRDRENIFRSNVLSWGGGGHCIKLHRHKVISVGYQVKQTLNFDFENSRQIFASESNPKIDPDTSVIISRLVLILLRFHAVSSRLLLNSWHSDDPEPKVIVSAVVEAALESCLLSMMTTHILDPPYSSNSNVCTISVLLLT